MPSREKKDWLYNPKTGRLHVNLTDAFKALRKAGYFARQNFLCCQSCGWAAIPEQEAEKAVFYHGQSNEDKVNGRDFYLYWNGDGKEICSILEANGIKTEWNGDMHTAIKVINH